MKKRRIRTKPGMRAIWTFTAILCIILFMFTFSYDVSACEPDCGPCSTWDGDSCELNEGSECSEDSDCGTCGDCSESSPCSCSADEDACSGECDECDTTGPDTFDCYDEDSSCDEIYTDCRYCDSGQCALDCTDSEAPLCNEVDQECVACLDDTDCEGNEAGEVCNDDGECVECVDDEDCEGNEAGEVCNDDGECVGCLDDEDCGGGGQICIDQECEQACEDSTDCEAGEVCAGGVCTETCNNDSDCPEGEICSGSGVCSHPCDDESDCGTGQICSGGVCTSPCDSDDDCYGSQFCGAGGTCEDGCSSDSDCGTGQVCSGGQCTDSCTSNSDCSNGQTCVDDECAEPCTPGECGTGQSCVNGTCEEDCTTDGDCESDECLPASDTCGDACTSNSDCSDCATCSGGTCQEPDRTAPECKEWDETSCSLVNSSGTCGDGIHFHCQNGSCICDADDVWEADTEITQVYITNPDNNSSFSPDEDVLFGASEVTDSDMYGRCEDNEWIETPEDDTTLSYSWTARRSGEDVGTFSSTNEGQTTHWLAPSSSGLVDVAVEVDDDGSLGDDGSKGDSVTIDVCGCFNWASNMCTSDGAYCVGDKLTAGQIDNPENDAPVSVNETISLIGSPVMDSDCYYDEAGTSCSSVLETTNIEWSDDTGRSVEQSFPEGEIGISVDWVAPNTTGSYGITGTWYDDGTKYPEDDSRDVMVKVYEAKITLCSNGGDPLAGIFGHSWWKLELNGPSVLEEYLLPYLGTHGWYPDLDDPEIVLDSNGRLLQAQGLVKDDSQQPYYTEHTWQISLDDLETALTHVMVLQPEGDPFSIYDWVLTTNNCTHQAVQVGQSAGISIPSNRDNPTTFAHWLSTQ